MLKKLLLIGFILFVADISAQIDATSRDSEIIDRFFGSASKAPIDSCMIKAALFFRGTPYIAGTLDVADTETLQINLREMDCLTFTENCMALSRTLRSKNVGMAQFKRELQQIRYRQGHIDGYVSRLHYASDWIFDNVKKGILRDVTAAAGGVKIKFRLNFMSSHSDRYRQLKNHPDDVATIKRQEQEINRRDGYYYIPKQSIEKCSAKIKSGDIICFTTSKAGMDISHLGIAYRHKGSLSFIHASLTAKKVIINPESLSAYCNKIKSNTGIIVLRMTDN